MDRTRKIDLCSLRLETNRIRCKIGQIQSGSVRSVFGVRPLLGFLIDFVILDILKYLLGFSKISFSLSIIRAFTWLFTNLIF
jgi:hypothetical protein